MNRRLTQAAVFIENALKEAVSSQQSAGWRERAAPLIKHHHRMLQLHHHMHVCLLLLVVVVMAGPFQLLKSRLFQTLASFIPVTPAIKKTLMLESSMNVEQRLCIIHACMHACWGHKSLKVVIWNPKRAHPVRGCNGAPASLSQ